MALLFLFQMEPVNFTLSLLCYDNVFMTLWSFFEEQMTQAVVRSQLLDLVLKFNCCSSAFLLLSPDLISVSTFEDLSYFGVIICCLSRNWCLTLM